MSGKVFAMVSPRRVGSQNEIRPHPVGRTRALVSKRSRLGEVRTWHVGHTRWRHRSRKAQSNRHKARNTGTRCCLVARCELAVLSDIFETAIAGRNRAPGKNTRGLQGERLAMVIPLCLCVSVVNFNTETQRHREELRDENYRSPSDDCHCSPRGAVAPCERLSLGTLCQDDRGGRN